MFVIPPLFVSVTALVTAFIVFFHDENSRISMKVFSLSFFMQFITYTFFAISKIPIETMQFISRSNVITTCLALSIILLVARRKRG